MKKIYYVSEKLIDGKTTIQLGCFTRSIEELDNMKQFDKKSLPKFIFVKDLQYFEGTLLAEYETKEGDSYVFHWCDCSDTLNRWLVARVSKRSLLQFESGLSTLHDLLYRDNLDETYYLLDIDTNQEIQKCFLVQKESIDIEYLPEEDTFMEQKDKKWL